MPNYRRAFVQNSYVFITIPTFKRNPLLIKNIELLRQAFLKSKLKYDYEIYASVVLPDHMHLILNPKNIEDYPKIVQAVKWHVSKYIDEKYIQGMQKYFSQSKIKRGEKGVWQRRYWEHTICSQEELNAYTDYIHYNPVKHKYVSNVVDWQYSSFHKFVENDLYDPCWGSDEDVKNITIMECE